MPLKPNPTCHQGHMPACRQGGSRGTDDPETKAKGGPCKGILLNSVEERRAALPSTNGTCVVCAECKRAVNDLCWGHWALEIDPEPEQDRQRAWTYAYYVCHLTLGTFSSLSRQKKILFDVEHQKLQSLLSVRRWLQRTSVVVRRRHRCRALMSSSEACYRPPLESSCEDRSSTRSLVGMRPSEIAHRQINV